MNDFNIDKLEYVGGEPKADGYGAINGGLGMGIDLDLDDAVYCHRVAREQLDTLRAKVKALEEISEAAKRLYDKMMIIHDDPKYKAVWDNAYIHGDIYKNGLDYKLEFDLLEAAIAKQEKENE